MIGLEFGSAHADLFRGRRGGCKKDVLSVMNRWDVNVERSRVEQVARTIHHMNPDNVSYEQALERLMGFGKIVIIFKDQKRPPLTVLVWRIGRRAELLERVRGKFAIDMNAAQPYETADAPQEPAEPVEPGQ